MAKNSGTTRTKRARNTTSSTPRVLSPIAQARAVARAFAPKFGDGNRVIPIPNSKIPAIRGVRNIAGLSTIPDPALYREVKRAISRFHSKLGVRQRLVKIADFRDNGRHYTVRGNSAIILLNRKLFSSLKEVEKRKKETYKSGWSTKTNKAAQHTVTHELAHALWNDALEGAKYDAAGREIKALFRVWKRDPDITKLGYGRYARKNATEFFAEAATKAVHGTPDYYTQRIVEIVKKYDL